LFNRLGTHYVERANRYFFIDIRFLEIALFIVVAPMPIVLLASAMLSKVAMIFPAG